MARLTDKEIAIICKALGETDGGCIHCAMTAARGLMQVFPEVDWETLVTEATGRY